MAASAPYVQLLGGPAITLAAGTLVFHRDKRYYLLAFLAFHRDWVTRERLAHLFWPEHDGSDARLNLRQLFKRTRRLGWQPELEMALENDDQRVRWMPATDLAALEQAMANRDWETALQLYRGPLLAGFRADGTPEFADWLDFERLRLQERWRDALVAHAAELSAHRRYQRAAHVLGLVLRQDGYDEEALRAYMTAAALAGQVKRALDAHDDFARRLDTEMQLIPSTATQALLQRIREGLLDTAPVPGPTPSLAIGTRPIVVPKDAGPPLPVAPPPLVGRELELSDLAHQLSHPNCRLLTLTGPGGVGKSCIAWHATAEHRPHFQDGAVFVPLEALPATGSIADAIASALALATPDRADPEPLERVVHAVGDKHLLLVLDNVEHLLHAAAVVSRLVAGCPRLVLLTTSRERLDLAEEWLLPIDGLAYPPPGTGLAEALCYDAVQLFVQRAERVRPAYYLSQDDLPFVLDVCRLVAGLPLGLELAAAWLRLLPCRDVAQEIESDTDFLNRSPSNTAERHRSIRATFEYSWQRLAHAEQSALRDLAVFRSEFDREAGMYVAATKLPVLAALVDRSLLRAGGDGRFSLHPLLRQYALEKLAADPEMHRRANTAHGRYHLRLLMRTTDLNGEAQRAALTALDATFEDVAAAWHWACAERPIDELSQAAAPLARLCVDRARYREGLALLCLAAASRPATRADGSLPMGRLLVQQARLEERLGRYEEAARDAHAGLATLRPAGASAGQRTGLLTLGKVALRSGRYGEARALFVDALASAKAQDLPWDIASLTGNVGLAEQYLGRRARAAVWYRRALALRRELDDLHGVVNALSNLGGILRLLRRPDLARELLDEALALAERIHAHDILPNLHINVGVLVLDQGEPAHATARFESALRLARQSGNRSLEVNAIFQLGKLAVTLGDAAASQPAFLGSLQLADEIGHREKVLDNVVGLAWSRAKLGDTARAERWLTIALGHGATSPGTKRWAEELRQALERGEEPLQTKLGRGDDGGDGGGDDGVAVAANVEKALAHTAD